MNFHLANLKKEVKMTFRNIATIKNYNFDDIMAGVHGYFIQELIMELLDDCKKKGIPFWLIDDDGSYVKRIV